jgi:hypothetical protein
MVACWHVLAVEVRPGCMSLCQVRAGVGLGAGSLMFELQACDLLDSSLVECKCDRKKIGG